MRVGGFWVYNLHDEQQKPKMDQETVELLNSASFEMDGLDQAY